MQEFLRWLASLRGDTIEPGAELRLEFASFMGGGSGLLIVIGIVLALVLVASIYRRDGRGLSLGRRTMLALLRCGAVLLAVLVLLEPNIVAVKKEERPGHTILLLDVSQSMGHSDAYRREEVKELAQAWQRLGVEQPVGAKRLELAKALLSHEDFALVKRLTGDNQVLLYTFSSVVDPMPVTVPEGQQETGAKPIAVPDLTALEPKGRYSNLGGSLRAALERSRDAAIAAVIILSDGRRNVGPHGPEVARLLKQRKVPHTLVLGIGDPSETQTIEVSRIEAPEKVFQKDPFRVRAQLASQGYAAMTVAVRLLRIPQGGGQGAVVATLPAVEIGGDKPERLVEFEKITSNEPGSFTYRVEVTPPDGEPANPERHGKVARVEVLAEQTRVLLISGGPSHEYRILLNTLKRDKTIELSCWLTSADTDFPQDGNKSIKALPSDPKELDAVDLLILIDPDPSRLTNDFCEMAAKHVLENGAGLWWVCGEKFTLEAMRSAASTRPIANLLPIIANMEKADREMYGLGRGYARAWRPELTTAGQTHPATRIVESKDENVTVWQGLPGFHFAFPVTRAKPGAQTLVGHGSPSMRRPEGPMPLVVTQFVGAGRVVFTGSDETYRWRSVFEDEYNRFWVKGIRYLFQGRLNAGNTRFRLYLSEDTVELGEAVKVNVEAKDEAYRPLMENSVELEIIKDGEAAGSFHLLQLEGMPGHYETRWRPEAIGNYRLEPAKGVGRKVEATLDVRSAAIEKEGPVDKAELAAIASVPGGELFATPDGLLGALSRIPSKTTTDVFRTPHPIWDTWVTIALILLLLATEWWLRKRFNLL